MTPYHFTGLRPEAKQDFLIKFVKKTPGNIINHVSLMTGVGVDDILSICRKREYVEARQMCMYLIKQHTKLSLVNIGKVFNRDHSTVIYALENVNDLRQSTPAFKARLQAIENAL